MTARVIRLVTALLTVPLAAGAPLSSSRRVFWKVTVWDRGGQPSSWSSPATWTMGLMRPDEWKGTWIGSPAATETLLLRRRFDVRGGLRRAVVHVSGLGQCKLTFNGTKVGADRAIYRIESGSCVFESRW